MEERVKQIIHKKFNDLLDEIRHSNYSKFSTELNNSLVRLRNEIGSIYDKVFYEIKTKKNYGVTIDFLNSDFKEHDLNRMENPYWLKGEIQKERPPGPTNTEIKELLNQLNKIQGGFIESLRKEISIEEYQFVMKIIGGKLFNLFSTITENIKFTKALYDRNPNIPFDKAQNTPCEICGENRSIDRCHIIPNNIGGKLENHNILYLCPTHHRLFDRFVLTKDEWDKIDWGKKGRASSNFAYYVLKPKMEEFWGRLELNVFEKRTPFGFNKSHLEDIATKTIIEVLNETSNLTIDDIVEVSKIKKPRCLKIINKLINDSIVSKTKDGRFVFYSLIKNENN